MILNEATWINSKYKACWFLEVTSPYIETLAIINEGPQ